MRGKERDADSSVLFRLLLNIRKYRKAVLLGIGLAVVLGFVVLLVGHVSVYKVAGRSMEDEFATGDILLVESLTFRVRLPRRFEVVVLRDPSDPGRMELKRVVGLPGETVGAETGRLLIGGVAVQPPPGVSVPGWFGPQVTSRGYFVLGDNYSFSRDSRAFGPVPPELIVGRVLVRLWTGSGQSGNRTD